jgi:hypothetical protein
MNGVELRQLPTYAPPTIEGNIGGNLVPPSLFPSFKPTESEIRGSMTDTTAVEAVLTLEAVGSKVSPRAFDCILKIEQGRITTEAQSGDFAFRMAIQLDPTAPTWKFDFRLLPNSLVGAALWFYEHSYEALFGEHPIRIKLQSGKLTFIAQGEFLPAEGINPHLVAQMDEMILLLQQLLKIEDAFHISFRLPGVLSAEDVLVTDMVYQSIKVGMLSRMGTYSCSIPASTDRPPHGLETDVVIRIKNVEANIFDRVIPLGPAVFFAPSATFHELGPAIEPGQVNIEIDFRQFGGYLQLPKYRKEPLQLDGTSEEELANQSHPHLVNLSPASRQNDLRRDGEWTRFIKTAQWEHRRREKRLRVLFDRQWEQDEKKMHVRQVTPEELKQELTPFEHRYGLSSEEFYEKFKRGEIQDTAETVEWCMKYRFYLYAIGQGDYQTTEEVQQP